MKKILFSIIFIVCILGAGLQTFASTVLNTNIVALIENTIANIITSVENNEKKISNDFDISDYIDEKNQELQNKLQNYKNEEIDKANEDLNNYINQIKQEIDSIYQNKENEAKREISDKIDKELQQLKDKIYKDLTQKLKN